MPWRQGPDGFRGSARSLRRSTWVGHDQIRKAFSMGFHQSFGRIPERSHSLTLLASTRKTRPGVRRCSTNRRAISTPRYRLATARRTVLLRSGSSRDRPSTVRPRNGGSVSKMMSEHLGSRSRCRSFTSPSAMTTSRSPSWNRNHTGDTEAVPSLRYVVNTAGDGRSRRTWVARDQVSDMSRFSLLERCRRGAARSSRIREAPGPHCS